MSKKLMFGMTGILVTACFVILLTGKSLYSQDAPAQKIGKNMQIFTGDKAFKSQQELTLYMKGLTEALGVQCSYCHNMRDFTADDDKLHKDEARYYMKFVSEINEKYFKDHPEEQITCYVCHRGREKPVFSKKEWMNIQAEEANN